MSITPKREIAIRKIEEADIEALSDNLSPEVSAKQVANRWRECEEGYREMLVAIVDSQPIGTVSVGGARHALPNSLRAFALDVGPAYRRGGIGTALMQFAEDIASVRGLRSVNLEVATENKIAQSLYERIGYKIVGKPVVERYERLNANGTAEIIEENELIMVKTL